MGLTGYFFLDGLWAPLGAGLLSVLALAVLTEPRRVPPPPCSVCAGSVVPVLEAEKKSVTCPHCGKPELKVEMWGMS